MRVTLIIDTSDGSIIYWIFIFCPIFKMFGKKYMSCFIIRIQMFFKEKVL